MISTVIACIIAAISRIRVNEDHSEINGCGQGIFRYFYPFSSENHWPYESHQLACEKINKSTVCNKPLPKGYPR